MVDTQMYLYYLFFYMYDFNIWKLALLPASSGLLIYQAQQPVRAVFPQMFLVQQWQPEQLTPVRLLLPCVKLRDWSKFKLTPSLLFIQFFRLISVSGPSSQVASGSTAPAPRNRGGSSEVQHRCDPSEATSEHCTTTPQPFLCCSQIGTIPVLEWHYTAFLFENKHFKVCRPTSMFRIQLAFWGSLLSWFILKP